MIYISLDIHSNAYVNSIILTENDVPPPTVAPTSAPDGINQKQNTPKFCTSS